MLWLLEEAPDDGAVPVAIHFDSYYAANLAQGRICYDLRYGAQAHFARWAEDHQASRSLDGLGMLVEQAAASYAIWMARHPSTEAVYQQLRDRLA